MKLISAMKVQMYKLDAFARMRMQEPIGTQGVLRKDLNWTQGVLRRDLTCRWRCRGCGGWRLWTHARPSRCRSHTSRTQTATILVADSCSAGQHWKPKSIYSVIYFVAFMFSDPPETFTFPTFFNAHNLNRFCLCSMLPGSRSAGFLDLELIQ